MTINDRIGSIRTDLERRKQLAGDSRDERQTAEKMRVIVMNDTALGVCFDKMSDAEIIRFVEDFIAANPEQFSDPILEGDSHPKSDVLQNAIKQRCP